MPVPVVRSSTSVAWASQSPITVSKPSGTVDGDLLVVFIAINGAQTINSVPSGWTVVQNDIGANGNRLAEYWKIASSEPASWDWGFSAAATSAAVALRIDTTDPTTPIGAQGSAQVNNTSAPSFANSVTPASGNSMLLMAVMAVQNGGAAAGYAIVTSNPSWTEVANLHPGSQSLAVAYAVRPEATATGNSSVTGLDATADSNCHLISITRQSAVSVSIQDSVAVSDRVSVATDYHVGLQDTVNVSDEVNADDSRQWTNQSKNNDSWTNQPKS